MRLVPAASERSATNGHEPTTGATLDELAEKLASLREHLEQVIAGLNALPEGPSAKSTTAEDSLRCYECGRTAPIGASGWTMRLCGDDVLHPFCPECEYRYFHRDNGRAGEGAEPQDTSLLK